MTNKNLKKGFTLIELLVVIAIIGILASVVVASLNSARDKGSDAAIKANLANIRAQAELYYDDNSGYGTVDASACSTASTLFVDTTIANAIAAASSTAGAAPTCYLDYDQDNWAISVPLKSGGDWCVDATGASKEGTATASGTCSI